MKFNRQIIAILFFLLAYSSAKCQYSPDAPVLIGDIVTFGRQTYGNGNCYPVETKYTHSNNDFFIELLGSPPYFNFQFSFKFAFAPTRVGVESDTFTIRVWWACPHGYIDTLGPFMVSGIGLSDSISIVRFLGDSGLNNRTWSYSWDTSSNRYKNYYAPPAPSIELINNVEDSTMFYFSVNIDTSAHIHSWIVIGSDSLEMPATFNCMPKVRRLSGSMYFFSDAKGFYKDTAFHANLKVAVSNSTRKDTLIQENNLFFKQYIPPKLDTTHSRVEMHDFSISISANNSMVFINSFLSQSLSADLQLFDALGRPQALPVSEIEIPAGESSQKIETGNLPSGWYMLRIKTKDQVFNKNFVVTR